MNVSAMRALLAATLLYVSSAVLAAPGTPIGGIIVKGGKNPGGQMRALATTDANGTFTIRFAEGGDYRLQFDASSRKDVGARMKAGLQVDYAIKRSTGVDAEPRGQAPSASRHTPFHNKLDNGQMVVAIPKGGAEIRGVLRSLATADETPAARAITESGVSASQPKPKGGVKK